MDICPIKSVLTVLFTSSTSYELLKYKKQIWKVHAKNKKANILKHIYKNSISYLETKSMSSDSDIFITKITDLFYLFDKSLFDPKLKILTILERILIIFRISYVIYFRNDDDTLKKIYIVKEPEPTGTSPEIVLVTMDKTIFQTINGEQKKRNRMEEGIKYNSVLKFDKSIYKITSSVFNDCKMGMISNDELHVKQIENKNKKIKAYLEKLDWLQNDFKYKKNKTDIFILTHYANDLQIQNKEFDLDYKEPIKNLECIRRVANLSTSKMEYKFDSVKFKPSAFLSDMPQISPKLEILKRSIEQFDKEDMTKHGKLFKHCIFSDVLPTTHGSKLIASLLMTMGFNHLYSKNHKITQKNNNGKGFLLLSKSPIYGKPLSINAIQHFLNIFNKRPDNIYGENVRFIIIDRSFKEGIDLFDIKYVHLFEPQLSSADTKQVIGRSTRSCGQSGLNFHPKYGWPLFVNIYDTQFEKEFADNEMFADTFHEYYLENMGINLKIQNFSSELEKLCIIGAIDQELTKNIHNFQIEEQPYFDIFQMGGKYDKNDFINENPFLKTRSYIHNHFFQQSYKWDEIKLFNGCQEKKFMRNYRIIPNLRQNKRAKLVTFTPTQKFIKDYFTPESQNKGMLLWHSVGTGKTCTAIATASHEFEKNGYTILWVTKTSLKSELWKNMFKVVCNIALQESIKNKQLDDTYDELSKNKTLLSSSWKIEPLSYKQFTNLIMKKNNFYQKLVNINGKEDPLKKTLIIVDEAHKLYNQEDLLTIEKPNMKEFLNIVQQSYDVSKKDSVRLLFLTGTPYTSDPMNFIKLLNLIIEFNKFPDEFKSFENEYLLHSGHFRQDKKLSFLNNIAGKISYLNQQKDPRKFSQPILNFIHSEMSTSECLKKQKQDKKLKHEIDENETNIQVLKNNVKNSIKLRNYEKKECSKLKNKLDKNKCIEDNVAKLHNNIELNRHKIQDINRQIKDLKEIKKKNKMIKNNCNDDLSQQLAIVKNCQKLQ